MPETRNRQMAQWLKMRELRYSRTCSRRGHQQTAQLNM